MDNPLFILLLLVACFMLVALIWLVLVLCCGLHYWWKTKHPPPEPVDPVAVMRAAVEALLRDARCFRPEKLDVAEGEVAALTAALGAVVSRQLNAVRTYNGALDLWARFMVYENSGVSPSTRLTNVREATVLAKTAVRVYRGELQVCIDQLRVVNAKLYGTPDLPFSCQQELARLQVYYVGAAEEAVLGEHLRELSKSHTEHV